MVHLLKTKVKLPPQAKGHTPRQRLIEQIHQHHDAPIVLLSAPAGFGKTTCLVEWAHTLRAVGTDVVWYALDEQDNDPVQFASYIMYAFELLDANRFRFDEDKEQPNLQTTVIQILNTVTDYDRQLVLILDDYHLITAPQVHDVLSRMCDYLPSNTRLVIGTRADPPLQLARLRSQRAIVELRMGDLRFTHDEMREWLKASVNWSPSEQTLNQLENLTEGWAAAVALIIMTMNRDASEINEESLSTQLEGFSRSQRLIYDYFAEEILKQQPPEIRQFLLDTCVLNRLHPDLCSALTGNHSAGATLNQLATDSLFVVSLSDAQPIYRYHHLFQHFLQQFLQMQNHSQFVKQHHLATEWYAQNDEIIEAVYHALRSDDYGMVSNLIVNVAWEQLTSQGRIMTLIRWLSKIPDDILMDYPRLCLYYSRALYLIGDLEQSESYVQLVLDVLKRQQSDNLEIRTIQAIALNYQATLTAYRGHLSEALSINQQIDTLDANLNSLDEVRAANTTAYIYYLRGDVDRAHAAYEHALHLARQLDHDYLMIDAHYYLAKLDLFAGQLHQAQTGCESVLATYDKQIAPLSAILLTQSTILYEKNQVVEAEISLRDAIKLAKRGQISDVLWMAYSHLAEMLAMQGEAEEALAFIHKARQVANTFKSPIMLSHIAATEARMMLQCNQVENAIHWANTYQEYRDIEFVRDFEDLTLARVLLAKEGYTVVLSMLHELINEAQTNGRLATVIEAEVLRAIAYQSLNQLDETQSAIVNALQLSQSQGYVRIFLDKGELIHTALSLALDDDSVSNYAQYLLDLAQRMENKLHPADQLTDREMEVLEQIANGLSNQEIADTLFISIGTVKSHIHHIMTKLDAQNRTEAVSKSRSLNILPE